MDQLVVEGDPRLMAGFEVRLGEELAALGVADQVTVESELVAVDVPPGEFGFGEEVRRVLIGVAKVLEAGEKAILALARGIAQRLARDSLSIREGPDGALVVSVATKGDVANTGEQLAGILRELQNGRASRKQGR